MTEVSVLEMFSRLAQRIEPGKAFGQLTHETKISSLGIDSVAMMEIVGCIEDELDIVIPDEKLAHLQSVGDIERVVKEQIGHA
jgi:acyl carrier protein